MKLSNWRITLLSAQDASREFLGFLKTYTKEIVALFFLQLILDQSVEYLSQLFKSGTNQSYSLIISVVLLSMFSEFFLSNAFLLLASKAFRSVKKLTEKDFDDYIQMIIEEVRAAGKILAGFIMFIFPGFNRLVHYVWVPFIVVFEDDYREGKIDALEVSKHIANHHFWYLSTVLTVTGLVSFVLDYLITSGEGSILVNRLPVLAAAVIGILLNVYFKLFYCALYRYSRERAMTMA